MEYLELLERNQLLQHHLRFNRRPKFHRVEVLRLLGVVVALGHREAVVVDQHQVEVGVHLLGKGAV